MIDYNFVIFFSAPIKPNYTLPAAITKSNFVGRIGYKPNWLTRNFKLVFLFFPLYWVILICFFLYPVTYFPTCIKIQSKRYMCVKELRVQRKDTKIVLLNIFLFIPDKFLWGVSLCMISNWKIMTFWGVATSTSYPPFLWLPLDPMSKTCHKYFFYWSDIGEKCFGKKKTFSLCYFPKHFVSLSVSHKISSYLANIRPIEKKLWQVFDMGVKGKSLKGLGGRSSYPSKRHDLSVWNHMFKISQMLIIQIKSKSLTTFGQKLINWSIPKPTNEKTIFFS